MSYVYYDPEDFGLKIVAQADWSDGYYQFDIFAVFADAGNNLYYGEDSGCSCPSPFENFNGLRSLTPVTFTELWGIVGDRATYHGEDEGRASKGIQLLEEMLRWKNGLEQR